MHGLASRDPSPSDGRPSALPPYDAAVSLDERCLEPEWMDDPALSAGLHDAALDGLARLNRVAGADRGFRRPIDLLLRDLPAGPVRLLDLATGSGDLPVRLDRWLGRRRPDLERRWIVVDISDHALSRATDRARAAGLHLEPHRRDVLVDDLPSCDVAMCSLFLHHLDVPQAIVAIRRLDAAAERGVVLGDLRRTRLGLTLASTAARLLTRSPVVHADAPASVRAAFDDTELEQIVHDAVGAARPSFARTFPQRRIVWWRSTKATAE